MNQRAAALGFLIVRTTRNRITKQLSRVRNPRYAFAILFGIGYLYLTFLRPGAPGANRGQNILLAMNGLAISILLLLTVAATWLLARDGTALAFLPAEVQFLFTAPLSRRQLLGYRIVRSQLVVLLNAVIWSFILRRFGLAIPAVVRFGTAWGLLSVLSLHQLGVALLQTKPMTGLRKLVLWTVRALAAGAVIAVVASVSPVIMNWGDRKFLDGVAAIGTALTLPPASIALAPFHLLTAPILAASSVAWLAPMGLVLLVIVAHLAWVLTMDVPFADVAVAASARRAARVAAMRAARGGPAVAPTRSKVTRQWLPLAPLGPPVVAIVWKNTMSLIRGAGARSIIIILAIGIPFVVMTQTMDTAGGPAKKAFIAVPFLVLIGMTLLMGPRLLRNDLRQDLLKLSTLKTYPLRGSTLVAGEVLSPTITLTAFQLVLMAVAAFTVPGLMHGLHEAGIPLLLLALVPPLLLVLNGVNVTIQNGVALMFPAWVKLGPDSGGVEAMGQNMLMTFGSMFALLLAMLLPVGAGVAAGGVIRFTGGASALMPALAAGATIAMVVIVVEIMAMVKVFGRTFEGMDPTSIG